MPVRLISLMPVPSAKRSKSSVIRTRSPLGARVAEFVWKFNCAVVRRSATVRRSELVSDANKAATVAFEVESAAGDELLAPNKACAEEVEIDAPESELLSD